MAFSWGLIGPCGSDVIIGRLFPPSSNGAGEITQSTQKLAAVCSFLTQITGIVRDGESSRSQTGRAWPDRLCWSSINKYNTEVILHLGYLGFETKSAHAIKEAEPVRPAGPPAAFMLPDKVEQHCGHFCLLLCL